ncbi:MAG: TIGR00269 family protein [Nanoarchaeota archaeon]|nr:TIGR00269 family protein [Nanoarchaeota archaeon]
MKCLLCSKKSVYLNPCLCKDHFITYFEDKVADTIKRFKLIKKNERVIAATSGGKDSLTVLYLLHKFGYNPIALIIDEGIEGYRDNTVEDLRAFCEKLSIEVRYVSFKDEFRFTLDSVLKNKEENPCTVCGILRRYLLNTHSRGFDVIATGHNLDDESQAVLMNLLRNNIPLLARLGPVSGMKSENKFTKRIKPLYFCTEKEVMAYSILKNIQHDFNECPYVTDSYRLKIREFLNDFEKDNKGTKHALIKSYLGIEKRLKIEFMDTGAGSCSICSEPSAREVCNACQLIERLKGK